MSTSVPSDMNYPDTQKSCMRGRQFTETQRSPARDSMSSGLTNSPDPDFKPEGHQPTSRNLDISVWAAGPKEGPGKAILACVARASSEDSKAVRSGSRL